VAADWRGKACLLFHRHNERLEGMRQLVILGELVYEEGLLTLRVSKFVTANGRSDTDQLPHAGSPLHMLQFWWLSRLSAIDLTSPPQRAQGQLGLRSNVLFHPC
jgi:hypothetical protein